MDAVDASGNGMITFESLFEQGSGLAEAFGLRKGTDDKPVETTKPIETAETAEPEEEALVVSGEHAPEKEIGTILLALLTHFLKVMAWTVLISVGSSAIALKKLLKPPKAPSPVAKQWR